MLKTVPGGGINARHGFVEVKFTFKEGGAYDFANAYEKVKEQVVQQREMANEIGAVGTGDVTLEPLPVYEARDSSGRSQEPARASAPVYERREVGPGDEAATVATAAVIASTEPSNAADVVAIGGEQQSITAEAQERSPRPAPPVEPNEPPPAYEA